MKNGNEKSMPILCIFFSSKNQEKGGTNVFSFLPLTKISNEIELGNFIYLKVRSKKSTQNLEKNISWIHLVYHKAYV